MPTATSLTARFDPGLGFVRLVAEGVPYEYYIFRLSPPGINDRYSTKLPAFDYSTPRQHQVGADYLAPIGEWVTYGLMKKADDDITTAVSPISIFTPAGMAYMRHLFYPSLGTRVSVVEFNDRRPSRLTTYAISGKQKAMATYDMRAGRDATLVIAVDGKVKRDQLERLLKDGAPVSLAMCKTLGNDPGIFAVADVDFVRWGKQDRWVVTMNMTEVDMPVVLGTLPEVLIPGVTYDDREAEIGNGTYDDAAAYFPHYYEAMA